MGAGKMNVTNRGTSKCKGPVVEAAVGLCKASMAGEVRWETHLKGAWAGLLGRA